VMKESAQAALTFIRSVSERLGAGSEFFQKHDIHVHVPAGAVPKDGPSAGVAMAIALASMVSGRVVDPNVAMTGEVTLTGQVLPVGGIKEKVLAARAAGITRVFLPDRNEADVSEIRGENLLEGLEFVYVDHVGTVLDQILASPKKARRPRASASAKNGGKPPSGGSRSSAKKPRPKPVGAGKDGGKGR
jgi:ATP-dependent Lon protease